MEKRHSQLEHGQPMEQTRGLFCTYDSGVARCQSQHHNASARSSACCMIITLLNDSERLLNSAL